MISTIVAVVVYDRFANVKEWIRCWNQCETQGSELVIIHNYPNESERDAYIEYCNEVGIMIISRENIGYDVGAFQDVCLERLEGFPNEWEYLIWVTDDTLPMNKHFIVKFTDQLKAGFSVAAMEICPTRKSRQVVAKHHIRTTGFAIGKELSKRLEFPCDPVVTKADCYAFEHRSDNIFLDQIKKWGLKCVQVIEDVNKSPLWDMGRPRQAHRKNEHYKTFPFKPQSNSKVTFICTIYNTHPVIVSALINQTHKNWHLLLLHDGPNSIGLKDLIDAHKDDRIEFIESKERNHLWGHPLRKWALEEIKAKRLSKNSDYVVVGNADNYIMPTFIEELLKGFEATPTAVACYTSMMSHSYIKWNIINCKFQQGYIDSGNVMIKTDIACDVGWQDIQSHSADFFYFRDIAKKYGAQNFVPVKGLLFVHN